VTIKQQLLCLGESIRDYAIFVQCYLQLRTLLPANCTIIHRLTSTYEPKQAVHTSGVLRVTELNNAQEHPAYQFYSGLWDLVLPMLWLLTETGIPLHSHIRQNLRAYSA